MKAKSTSQYARNSQRISSSDYNDHIITPNKTLITFSYIVGFIRKKLENND